MANNMSKVDPIRKKYYEPIEKSDLYYGFFFKVSIFLSFLIAYTDDPTDKIQIAFCLFVSIAFILDISNRLYLKPRADDMRLKDFLSHAYSIPLNHDQTKFYFNNNEKDKIRRLAAQLFENSLHSKTTASEMAKETRWQFLIYLVIFTLLCLNRSTSLEMISVATQVIFSEQILSLVLRTEWTRYRYERVYDDIYSLFVSNPNRNIFEIKTFEALVKYETTKANGGIILSSAIFESNNNTVSVEWDLIKAKLNIL
jgi:hypothetical protein